MSYSVSVDSARSVCAIVFLLTVPDLCYSVSVDSVRSVCAMFLLTVSDLCVL